MRRKNIINVKVLPGEPTDGRGRVCIHFFVQDEQGPFVEPSVLHPVFKDGVQVKQKVTARPTRGRLACDLKRNAAPVTRDGVTTITLRTDNPRAVTCPKCIASEAYAEIIKKHESVRANVLNKTQ